MLQAFKSLDDVDQISVLEAIIERKVLSQRQLVFLQNVEFTGDDLVDAYLLLTLLGFEIERRDLSRRKGTDQLTFAQHLYDLYVHGFLDEQQLAALFLSASPTFLSFAVNWLEMLLAKRLSRELKCFLKRVADIHRANAFPWRIVLWHEWRGLMLPQTSYVKVVERNDSQFVWSVLEHPMVLRPARESDHPYEQLKNVGLSSIPDFIFREWKEVENKFVATGRFVVRLGSPDSDFVGSIDLCSLTDHAYRESVNVVQVIQPKESYSPDPIHFWRQ